MKKFLKEFKEFAVKGNVVDMAVGVIIGGAFGKIVSSLVGDVIMPLIGLVTGGFNVSGAFVALDGNQYATLEAAQAAGAATLNYGAFIQAIIDFLIIALCIFTFIKMLNGVHKKEEAAPAPEARLCPFCRQPIADDATRCPHCTSELK